MKLIDLTGEHFGKWVVLGRNETRHPGKPYWFCQCDCGEVRSVRGSSLRCGDSTSCGKGSCSPLTTHGLSGRGPTKRHAAYNSWIDMRKRCYNSGNKRYARYGGRGITVCDSWKDSFSNFWDDMGSSWFEGATIDRIDFDGNYEPRNCRWVTASEQARNRSNNTLIDTKWGRVTLAEASEKSGVRYGLIQSRVYRGESGDALFRPPDTMRRSKDWWSRQNNM